MANPRQGSTGNVIAAISSLFIPGLGQLVQGRFFKAVLMFVLAGVLWFVLLGPEQAQSSARPLRFARSHRIRGRFRTSAMLTWMHHAPLAKNRKRPRLRHLRTIWRSSALDLGLGWIVHLGSVWDAARFRP